MIYSPVADDLEVLGLMPFGGFAVMEGVEHAHTLVRLLLDALDKSRFGEARRFQYGRGHIDHMVELGADFAPGTDASRPVDNGAVARSAPVRGDLFGPLVGGIHGVCPAYSVVVVCLRCAELVDVLL